MSKEDDVAKAFHIGNVSLKLPPFIEDDPEAWFALIEAQFELRYILSDSTKFYHAVSVLQGEPQRQIKDILKLPKETENKYEQLKARLIQSYGMHELDRAAKVMSWPSMSLDEKPSIYINTLLAMMADITTDHPFVRSTVLSKLPVELTEILRATCDCNDIRTIAKVSDQIWNGSRISTNRGTSIQAIKGQMQKTASKGKFESFPNVNGMCPWHHMYGNKARTCRDPCSFIVHKSIPKEKKKLAGIFVESDAMEACQGNFNAGSQ